MLQKVSSGQALITLQELDQQLKGCQLLSSSQIKALLPTSKKAAAYRSRLVVAIASAPQTIMACETRLAVVNGFHYFSQRVCEFSAEYSRSILEWQLWLGRDAANCGPKPDSGR